jgi:hypothetical protein
MGPNDVGRRLHILKSAVVEIASFELHLRAAAFRRCTHPPCSFLFPAMTSCRFRNADLSSSRIASKEDLRPGDDRAKNNLTKALLTRPQYQLPLILSSNDIRVFQRRYGDAIGADPEKDHSEQMQCGCDVARCRFFATLFFCNKELSTKGLRN